MKIYKTFDEWFDDNHISFGYESYHDAENAFNSRQPEIEQLKKVISGFEKMMAANVLIPNDEYESLIATIKKPYDPNYIINTNQTIVKLVKNTEQLKARINRAIEAAVETRATDLERCKVMLRVLTEEHQ